MLRAIAWARSRRCARAAAIACLMSACTREPEGRFAQEQAPEPAAATPGELHFSPTVRASVRDGETVVPVLELATATAGRVDAVVAVARAGHDPAIELWRFEQPDPTATLVRVGDPEPLLRGRQAAAPAPALQPLRLRMAAPGATVQRRLGVAGADPAAVLAELAVAATRVRDGAATPALRTDALATVFVGLDDGVLFERDALGLALDRLAAGAWTATQTTSASDRRARVETRGGDALELLRKGDGWVVAAIETP
jgi:hypothetical protein